MENMTLKLIYALKSGKYKRGTLEKNAIAFMSEYTDTPEEYYTDSMLKSIARQAFIDYLRTADNPAFDVWQYFDAKNFRDNDTYGILSALQLTRVKNDNGEYVNGFRSVKE